MTDTTSHDVEVIDPPSTPGTALAAPAAHRGAHLMQYRREMVVTPEDARAQLEHLRDFMRTVMRDGIDYDEIPGTNKPSLLKPGAETLLGAFGFGFTMRRTMMDPCDRYRDDETEPKVSTRGVSMAYVCTVTKTLPNGEVVTVAECEGFAGNDEKKWRDAPTNTVAKMAQKRALVGGALNACAASELFTQDVEDIDPSSGGGEAGEWQERSPEDKHRREGAKLFKTGFPFGDCKGGDMMDPDAVADKDLDYYLSRGIKDDKWKDIETKRHTWIRAELHRRHLVREAAKAASEPTGFEQPAGVDDSDIPFGSDGGPAADYDAGAYAAQRTDGTKARQEADASQQAFENVTDVEVIEEEGPDDRPQPEWAAGLPSFPDVRVDWNHPDNARDRDGMGPDVQRLLAATLAAGGRLDPESKQLVPITREQAMQTVNAVNAQRIREGRGPLTNELAIQQIVKIAPRINASQFP